MIDEMNQGTNEKRVGGSEACEQVNVRVGGDQHFLEKMDSSAFGIHLSR